MTKSELDLAQDAQDALDAARVVLRRSSAAKAMNSETMARAKAALARTRKMFEMLETRNPEMKALRD